MAIKQYQFSLDTNRPSSFSPDSFSPSSIGGIPSGDFVISRDTEGHPLSRYRDMAWDFSAYDIRKRNVKIRFDNWNENAGSELGLVISEDIKYVLFATLWLTDNSYRAVNTIYKLKSVLAKLAQFAWSEKVGIFEILKSELLHYNFIRRVSGGIQISFFRMLKLLLEAGSDRVGFYCCSPSAVKGLSESIVKYRDSLQQHPPIPPRIYLSLIKFLQDKMSEYERHIEGLKYLINKYLDDSYDGGTLYSASLAARRNGLMFQVKPNAYVKNNKSVIMAEDVETIEKIVKKFDLIDFYRSRKLPYTPLSLNKIFLEIYTICNTVIHVFSGMRYEEVKYLPYQCLENFTSNGRKAICIRGVTTKLGVKRVLWVTNQDGQRAIELVQSLALTIYKSLGVTPTDSTDSVNKYPLFVKPSFAGMGMLEKCRSIDGTYTPVKSFKIQSYISETILDEDLAELEKIDPYRAWRSESKFKLGSNWVFTSHQYRRSLALYASSSGLVSLPSLKRQLQHISQTMALYYSKGSSFAKDLLSKKSNHFVKEYQETLPISQALSFIENVIFSDERLFGGAGSIIEKTRNEFSVYKDREKTISMFRNGEVAYQETILGGCATTSVCKKKALRSFTPCLKCIESIIKKSKLHTVIKAQEQLVRKLDPDSVEFRTEYEELCNFRAALEAINCKAKRNE